MSEIEQPDLAPIADEPITDEANRVVDPDDGVMSEDDPVE